MNGYLCRRGRGGSCEPLDLVTEKPVFRRKCRACQAELVFARDKNGQIQVLDARPAFQCWAIETDLVGDERAVQVEAFVTHWATCPKRDDFKKMIGRQP